ncbi:FAD-dependent thymidylate synthase [Asticcacaulis benevestitus]|nr:FAD-dependent thymidylate synthase [Asticcacaulis benevestitus]
MKIRVFDEFEPEALAMLQALYSRSGESVDAHAVKVAERGAKKFMESYYVGYGHASIGDCGVTTLFIEGASMLACKAFQNNPLYSGQESSTRYIDFAQQKLVSPIDDPRCGEVQKKWIRFYLDLQAPLIEELSQRFPREPGQKETVWQKAIQAKAFDIARGFLPAGTSTQFSWTTNFRQAAENLALLAHHPLAEVQLIAGQCIEALQNKYPSSFSHQEKTEVLEYNLNAAKKSAYDTALDVPTSNSEFIYSMDINNSELERTVLFEISKRPRSAQLPRELQRFGSYDCKFLLDFGSFRDLQRHRNGYCAFPLLTDRLGFHNWYFDQLPKGIQQSAKDFVANQIRELQSLRSELQFGDEEAQYYLPLGMNVSCHLRYSLPQMVYVSELRSRKTVHPTLRWVAQQMARTLTVHHPKLAVFADFDSDDFDIRRGDQDIVERKIETVP